MFGAPLLHAQQYPAKQVRVIVPFAAGGTPDVVARVIAQQLSTQTGQTFVVENRPGADGVVGSQAVAESSPDGYTILVTSSSFVVNPSFHKTMPFNVVHDFEPVTNIAATEAYILGVNPKVPAQNVQEFIALARQPDNNISFGSPGVGNGLHLAAELFRSLTKTRMVHVPYRGAAPGRMKLGTAMSLWGNCNRCPAFPKAARPAGGSLWKAGRELLECHEAHAIVGGQPSAIDRVED